MHTFIVAFLALVHHIILIVPPNLG